MKRNLRVVQINGLRGLVVSLFIFCCLIAGFMVFPGFLVMNVWNYFTFKIASVPSISFVGGLLLWSIIVMSFLIFKKKNFIVSFNAPQELTESEVGEVLSRLNEQRNSSISISKRFSNTKNDSEEEKTPVPTPSNKQD